MHTKTNASEIELLFLNGLLENFVCVCVCVRLLYLARHPTIIFHRQSVS